MQTKDSMENDSPPSWCNGRGEEQHGRENMGDVSNTRVSYDELKKLKQSYKEFKSKAMMSSLLVFMAFLAITVLFFKKIIGSERAGVSIAFSLIIQWLAVNNFGVPATEWYPFGVTFVLICLCNT